jgi:hypothetical protein
MIKIVYTVRARGDIDLAEFYRYWLEDEKHFVDLAGSTMFVTEEHEIFDFTADRPA